MASIHMNLSLLVPHSRHLRARKTECVHHSFVDATHVDEPVREEDVPRRVRTRMRN